MVLAQTVYVMFGFGSGLIAVGCMALFIPVTDVVVVLLLVSLPSELFVVGKARKVITWRGVLLICIGLGGGILAGTWILTVTEPTFVLTLLACFLIAAGAAFLLMPTGARIRWPSWSGLPVGVSSGVLAGMFGTGGPPLIFYYQLAGTAKAKFRGNLMAIFLLSTSVRIPVYAVVGLISVPRLLSAAAMLPVALAGAWLGNTLHFQMSEARFRQTVSVALCLIGLLLLIR